MRNKKWNMLRHKFVFVILRPFFRISLYFNYRYRFKKYKMKKNEPCIIISNHCTALDQFLVIMSFKRVIHFIAADDLFVLKVSPIIRYLVAPIPKTKANSDVRTILDCGRALKKGAAIGVFPEGNRSYSGQLCDLNPAIVKMIRFFKVPVILYKISGGFGVDPRWASGHRRGKSFGEVVRRVDFEEYNVMSDEELYSLIIQEISYDDVRYAKENGIRYKSKKKAEFLERVLYYCPYCKSFESLESQDDNFICNNCKVILEYTEELVFKMVGDGELIFETVYDWYKHQEKIVTEYFSDKLGSKECHYEEENLMGYCYKVGDRLKSKLGNISIRAFSDRYEVINCEDKIIYLFDDITSIAVYGKNNFLFYHKDIVYMFKTQDRMCGLKFVHLYYVMRNIKEGKDNVEFMGI